MSAKSRLPKRLKQAHAPVEVRHSGVHGRGVFALEDLDPGTLVYEYLGEVIDWPTALERHPHDPAQPFHTFYFTLDSGHVIDAAVRGNDARWINHGCEPNCEASESDGRVFIHTQLPVLRGQELLYDYGLVIDARYTQKLRSQYACRCGARLCRGTMLAPKSRRKFRP